jgi:hypothetical protein
MNVAMMVALSETRMVEAWANSENWHASSQTVAPVISEPGGGLRPSKMRAPVQVTAYEPNRMTSATVIVPIRQGEAGGVDLAGAVHGGRRRRLAARQDAQARQGAAAAETVQLVIDLVTATPPGEATHWTGRMLAKAAGVSLRSVQPESVLRRMLWLRPWAILERQRPSTLAAPRFQAHIFAWAQISIPMTIRW